MLVFGGASGRQAPPSGKPLMVCTSTERVFVIAGAAVVHAAAAFSSSCLCCVLIIKGDTAVGCGRMTHIK